MAAKSFSSASGQTYKLVLLRHGESVWNKENRFTGWKDVDLTAKGETEAAEAGKLLKEKDFRFDVCFTSVLRRAIKTYHIAADVSDHHYIPHYKHWRLNERHYGALQGLNKAETAAKHGEEQVLVWRRSYDIPPPALEETDERNPANDLRYGHLPTDCLPLTECLKDTVKRVLPFWYDSIAPAIRDNKRVIIVAHGNSLRALVKHLDGISEKEIVGLNIPTGIPLVYELNSDLKPIKSYYLMDEEELKAKMQAVADQGKAK